MKRLSQTWRQKHRTTETVMAAKNSTKTDIQEGTPRRSQRLARSSTPKHADPVINVLQDITKSQGKNVVQNKKSNKNSPDNTGNSSGQCSLFSTSFGFEFDADVLTAVDKMEKEHLHVRKKSSIVPGVSPITPFCPKQSSSPMCSMDDNVNALKSISKNDHVNENASPGIMDNKGHEGQPCTHTTPKGNKTCIDNRRQMGQFQTYDTPKGIRKYKDGSRQARQSCALNSGKDSTIMDEREHTEQSCTNGKPRDNTTYMTAKAKQQQPQSERNFTRQPDNSHPIPDKNSEKVSKNLRTEGLRSGVEPSDTDNTRFTSAGSKTPGPSAIETRTERSPVKDSEDRCHLSSWGLPESILKQYEKIGIKTMFEWQAECLCTGNALNGGNLVYSAPTSAGKTMVAEILMLKRIIETKCKALFILPFVSVAREKMYYLQRMFQEAGIKVDGYMGSVVPTKGFNSIDIAVCTIEKANGLVNRLMEEGQLHTVGAIIVDEMHLIGDTSRGYLLELLLTKVLYMEQATVHSDDSSKGNVQIIGMSATLPNLNVLAKWLRADLFFTNFRPVPLVETFKVGPIIYDTDGKKIRELSQSRMVSGDDDHVLLLCQETVEDGHAVLMFCPTKSWCEKLAETVARHFHRLGGAKLNGAKKEDGGFVKASSLVMFDYEGLRDVFEQLKSCQVGLDSVLGKTLRYGVAYHHAGLTFDERDIIEGAFRQGIIKVLIATSTLSSGVNLPARRVIIRTPIFHGKLMDGLVYKQMSGRAGRKGVDCRGESILICKPAERQKANSLLKADLKPVESCLVVKRSDEDEGNGIKRALLEVIASGVAMTPADVQRYASCTFYVSSKSQEDGRSTESIIESTVEYLVRNEFITLRKQQEADSKKNSSSSECFVPTQLGQATLASSLSPDEALVVFADLQKARKCFVLENELHIIYQVTPIYLQDQWPNLDWYQYLKIWGQLPSHMKRVAELVGIEERFLSRAIRGRVPMRTEAHRRTVGVHKRFYVSLALQDLVHEVPLDAVARKFGASRGMLQSLQSSAATFAGMVTVFCHKLGWVNLEMLLSQFHNRLTFGVERELCDLVRIQALNGFRARLLYSAGYHTVAAVASASPVEIEKHLRNATPFQSRKRSEWESERDLQRRMRAKCVWVNGRRALTEAEASREIVEEAKKILKQEASKLGMEWKPNTVKSDHVLVMSGDASKTSGDASEMTEDAYSASATPCVSSSRKTSEACAATGVTAQTDSEVSKTALEKPSAQPGTAHHLPRTTSEVPHSSSVTSKAVCERSDLTTVPSLNTARIPRTSLDKHRSTVNAMRTGSNQSETDSEKLQTECQKSRSSCTSTNHSVCPPKEICNVQSATKIPVPSVECHRLTVIRNPNASLPGCASITPDKKGAAAARTIDFSHITLPGKMVCSSDATVTHTDVEESKTMASKEDDVRSMKRRYSVTSAIAGCSAAKRNMVDPRETQSSTKDQSFSTPVLSHAVSSRAEAPSSRCTESPIPLEKAKRVPIETIVTRAIPFAKHCSRGNDVTRDNVTRCTSKESTTACPSSRQSITSTSGSATTLGTREMTGLDRMSSTARAPEARDVTDGTFTNTMASDGKKAAAAVSASSTTSSPDVNRLIPLNNVAKPADNKLTMTSVSVSSTTKTPDSKKSVSSSPNISPELIMIVESPDNDRNSENVVEEKFAVGATNNRRTSETSLALSPELYSEALFPDHVSPPGLSQNSGDQGRVSKLSESYGFEVMDTSMELYSEETNETNARSMSEDWKNTKNGRENIEQSCGTNNAEKDGGEENGKRQQDLENAMEICTPGMFDSEVCYSQSVLCDVNNNTSADDRVFADGTAADESRRSSASFSLRLSQSLEITSDSDLSTRTLAAVAAMEQEQNKARDIGNREESQGPQGFQVDSDISIETVAAIEAMETEIGQRIDNPNGVNVDGESRFTVVKDRSYGMSRTSSLHHDDESFKIIDVMENRKVYNTFLKECKTKSFSFAVALEKLPHKTSTIGRNFNKEATQINNEFPLSIQEERVVLVGVSVCWNGRSAYYLPLSPVNETPGGSAQSANIQHQTPFGLTLKERLDSLQVIMESSGSKQLKTALGVKSQYKVLSQACGVVLKGHLQDPKVATWLLDPGAKERSFHQMVEHFLPQETTLLQGIGGSLGMNGLGLAAHSPVPARTRSCLEAVLTRKLMEHVKPMLESEGLLHAFTKIEMPVVSCLARMELNGFGFSNDECERIKHVLQAKLRALEQEAYRMANRSFSLTSPEEVSRILFLELKLPPDGNSDTTTSPGKPCAVKPTRGGRTRKVKYFSTSKDVLEKLFELHPLPRVILEWRRVNSALTKVVFPVQKEQVHCGPPLNMSRIYPIALTHTATGRVTFVEPNLQNVPKDFDINLPTVISDTPPLETIHPPRARKGRKRGKKVGVYVPQGDSPSSSPGPQFSVSMRSAFLPFPSGVLLAADYSQLELRLMAHLSSDEKLTSFLNAGGDVFRMIGGEMFHIAQESVCDEQRQRAKQVCYGIIYGIGAKALGQRLNVNEEEAASFVEAFKSRFVNVRNYLKKTVDECRKLGYVTTISGRKRHLPHIRASNAAAKAHAERQAVNTTVQGSAADLVKLAMANIDRRLCDEFAICRRTHRQRSEDAFRQKSTIVGKQVQKTVNFRGAYLVLQLHDELLFEVADDDVEKVIGIVKDEMESAIKLSVKIPVKIKMGKSWGCMEPVEDLEQ